MATYVFLGHGDLKPQFATFPPELLVPPGTSLRFFSDAGQTLYLPQKDGNTDYTRVVNVWEHFHEEEAPIPERWVTYNFRLSPEDTDEERQLAMSLDWGAEVVSLPAGSMPLYLCQGTADTCPTPMLNVQQAKHERGEGGPVPDSRWEHDCEGILGQYAGHELIWMACTAFSFATPELPSLVTAGYSGPGVLDAAKWEPDENAWRRVQVLNLSRLGAIEEGGSVAIVAGGDLVLIGAEHSRQAGEYVARQDDMEEGMLTIGTDEIEVSGISAKQDYVKAAIEQLSEKSINFV